ncbi:MAG: DUF192 domain-containing protein [Desulfobacteraceae bacterium]|nr:DUF192 domain-containing protein [Desulfobacteraceae bacterium]
MKQGTLSAAIIAVFFLCSWAAWGSVCLACPMDLPRIVAKVKGQPLALAVAATPEARQCGLSRRDKLAPDEGMLFIQPAARALTFWMKDTQIALAIAFIDDAGFILSIEQMAPLKTDQVYRSPQPVRYAVEVNQGWFAEHGVGIGDKIQLSLPAGLEIR